MEKDEIMINQTSKTELKKFLNDIPSGKIKAFVDELKKETGTSDAIFRNWRNGITPIPVPARKIMNMISTKHFEKEIFTFSKYESKYTAS